MTISIFDLFKIGIGPSSSHTVGPMVAARLFLESLSNEQLYKITSIKAEMFGSLGATGKGHGTPKAIILGLMGEKPETVNVDHIETLISSVKNTYKLPLLDQHSIEFNPDVDIILHRKQSLAFHPNGMRFSVYQNEELILEKNYYSVGGGFVVDDNKSDTLEELDNCLPYDFNSAEELLVLCDQRKLSIADIMWANEIDQSTPDTVEEKIQNIWTAMKACIQRGLNQEGVLPGSLKVNRRAGQIYQALKHKSPSHSDPLELLDWVTVYALAVNEENAGGGRIVTAPTNGAAGIIPAVLNYYYEFIEGADFEGIKTFLLTAAAIGTLFKKNASISGAEVGCQGEVGSACSMAAAGLSAVLGGSPKQIENAAEIAMEHHLGLTCDPVGGLVQIPCIERNAVASVKAIHAARIAMQSDGSHVVSLDMVVKTMRETGRDMQEKYKETSRGGLATNVVEVPVNIIEC